MNAKKEQKRIYLDHAAATPLDPRVFEKMEPYFSLHCGNAGGIHAEGRAAKEAITGARKTISGLLQARPEEIIFTGSGTEGNNLAIFGYMHALKKSRDIASMHVLTSSAEHPSVLDCVQALEAEGASVTYLDFNERGLIDLKALRKALRKETVLVSIAYVNSEIGTVQPLSEIHDEIKKAEKEYGTAIIFHTDASQAPLYFDCTPRALGVDLMTIDAQKLYGPKGVGFLYKSKNVSLEGIMKGGGQEFGLRPGTENVPLIVGLAEAFQHAAEGREAESARLTALRDVFIAELKKEVPNIILNGDERERSPNNINVSIPGIDTEYLVVALDEQGIAAATRSACLSDEKETASHVLESINGRSEGPRTALRFSLGRDTTGKDLERVVSVLAHEVRKFDKIQM